MREVLFRGKRTDTGEWVYGSLVYWPGDDEIGTIVVFESEDEAGFIFGEHIEVYLNTVGQYTGKLDAIGEKIFEGDVCEERFACDTERYEILYSGSSFSHRNITVQEKYGTSFDDVESGMDPSLMKIIGNIHDNPELLEVGDNV